MSDDWEIAHYLDPTRPDTLMVYGDASEVYIYIKALMLGFCSDETHGSKIEWTQGCKKDTHPLTQCLGDIFQQEQMSPSMMTC